MIGLGGSGVEGEEGIFGWGVCVVEFFVVERVVVEFVEFVEFRRRRGDGGCGVGGGGGVVSVCVVNVMKCCECECDWCLM